MSKAVKSVASIALPIAGAVAGSFVGMPQLGAALGGAVGGAVQGNGIKGVIGGAAAGYGASLGPVGGAIGGAVNGGINGGLEGAVMGGLSGYAAGGIQQAAVGTVAGAPLSTVTGNAAAQGPTQGSGILGATTGGGVRALGNTVSQAATSAAGSPVATLLGAAGNAVATSQTVDATEEAARIQAEAIDRGIATQQPYNELGTSAAKQIQQIQSDPGAYVQNNPFYKSLADDAANRLKASEASKGKLASGGTADALQTSLLNLGNGLVQQQVGTLQNQVNSGQTAASNITGGQVGKGNVQSAGVMGVNNAMQTGYQNQISTLLALQNLNKAPSYQPTAGIRA